MMRRWLWRAAWLILPLAWAVQHYAHDDALTFVLSCLVLVPLARSMGNATEALAERMGPAAGSLLNATFGNAAELILGIAALRHGHVALVKGSLTGSILGNLLLVAGGSIVVGGARFAQLKFNRMAAASSVSTLFLAVVAMVVPTFLAGPGNPRYQPRALSLGISAILIAMYALSLLFTLRTHRHSLSAAVAKTHKPAGGSGIYVVKLMWAAAATAWASELLVGALDGTLVALHAPETFVGVVIVAIVGNAAEHSSAILFASRGEMDVALGIPWESSRQIALFVAPVLVFASLFFGAPMDLAFTRFEVIAIGLAVLSLSLIALDGETHWLEGAFLLAVYAVLGMGFFFVG
jgi:Ca2+:H+ antiporter